MLNKTKGDTVVDQEAVKFQDALQDVVVVLTKLGPLCKDVSELVGMCESGLHSLATARLLLGLVKGEEKTK